jgi:uncharacterized membrane protein YczE/cytidylate kinase
MKKKHLTRRIVAFVIGLFIVAMGVALSIKANLGVSPISSVPYVYSLGFPLSMGATTVIVNVLLILGQILILRSNYKLVQLVQLPVVLLFGFFTDFTLFLVADLTVTTYVSQLALCLLSCVVIGFGVFLEVRAGLTFLPGEGIALALTEAFHIEFGKTKIICDSSLVIIGVISSYILFGSIEGAREGTVLAAVLVGLSVRAYNRVLPFVGLWLTPSTTASAKETGPAQPDSSRPHLVITISREFGSGGHEIGQRIAQQLNLPFYDKELIRLSAEQGGFTPQYIRENEQKLSSTLLYRLYEQNYAYVNEQIPPLDALFLVQSKIIRDISAQNSCVIVGRCANFILKDNPMCVNAFVHADEAYRRNRAITQYGVAPEEVDHLLERTDRERENYCQEFTGKHWRDASNYHLSVNTSLLGIENSVQLIIEAAEKVRSLPAVESGVMQNTAA